ncbi:MAG: GNAT family N-acetyltransferase [Solirubrobacteraceae bacterium]|nr:GNAT family N-acetyltransferase [Solirubrobacteraceae bacterium]
MHPPLEIRPADSGSSPGRELITAMLAELDALYGKLDGPRPTATPEELSAERGGAFFLAWKGEHAVASGGFKRLEGDLAEVKRIYVVPRWRSRGIASDVLDFVEQQARAAGYRRLRLQHGADQPHAMALYTSAGYHAIPDYNGNPYAAHWAEKLLD